MTSASTTIGAPRRELATRHAGWARLLARTLAASGIRPNTVSVAGVGFALLSGAGFYFSSSLAGVWRPTVLLVAAACIQLRLLCNLLDGMLAVEEGLKSPSGEIFNEVPDRVADVVILVGAGYAASSSTLGWMAALAAVFTAYVRVFGGSLGLNQHFTGPMAKQHRMFTLTLATLLAVLEASLGAPPRALAAALLIIVAGSLLTAVRRIRRILSEVEAR